MGCTASTDNSQYLLQIEQLRQQMEQDKIKAHEQQNLLRFKVEVLVNMLAVEEKRSEEHAKRIDTMQWLLAKQGLNEETLGQMLIALDEKTREKFHSSMASSKLSEKSLLPDVGTVVDKMRDEFTNNRDDILHAFSRSDGKIVSIVPVETFIKQICEVTETLTPMDAKVLTIRFDDGTGGYVSITEFIDFFVTPPSVRTARVAASAVRMSLDLFSLNVELLDNINEDDPEFLLTEEELELLPPEMRKTHFTDILDRGAKRLLVMWTVVREELDKQLSVFAKKNDVEKVIEVEIFQNALEAVCGPFSEYLEQLCKEGKITIKTGPKPLGYVSIQKNSNISDNESSPTDEKDKENQDANTTSPVPPPRLSSNQPSSNATPVPSKKQDQVDSNKPPKTPVESNASSKQTKESDTKVDEKSTLVVEPLEKEDIAFLAERFELSGVVHYGYFLEFFDNTFKRFLKYKKKFKNLPQEASGVSPFVYSSEWNALKASSILRKSKDQIRMSRSIERKPSEAPKTFTAPKQLPPPRTEEKPKTVAFVEPEKPAEPVVEPPKAEEKKEEKKEEEKPIDPPKAEEKEIEEKKEEEKKIEPPSTPAPLPAPVKTAPVVSQSGCFLCSLGKSEPKKADPPAIADAKAGITPPVKRDTPLHKQVSIDVDTPPEKESKDVAESKLDLPPIKRSESPRPFRVPKGFDSESSDDGGMLPNREGLGHGRNDDTPIIQPKPKGSRFRRREEQDFAREKHVEEDPEEMEEDQRYHAGGKK